MSLVSTVVASAVGDSALGTAAGTSGAEYGEVILAAGGTKGVIIEILGFIVVVGVLGRWIIPLVLRLMSAKQAAIAKQLADSEAAGQKLAEAQAAYDNAVAEARAEAEQIRADARAQGEAIVAEAAAAAQARAEEITTRATEALEAERVSAVRGLQTEIAKLTVELAERQVRDALADDARARRVTDRFLDELESGRIATSGSATGSTVSETGGRPA